MTVSELRRRLDLSQSAFGQRFHSSAMAVSRWERGVQEPPTGSYIELRETSQAIPFVGDFWGSRRRIAERRCDARHAATQKTAHPY